MTEGEAVYSVALASWFALFAIAAWRNVGSATRASRYLLVEAVVLTQAIPVLVVVYPHTSPIARVSSLVELTLAVAFTGYLVLARRRPRV